MTRPNVMRVKVAFISTLLVLGLMANTARADGYEGVIAPLATFVLLNSMFQHNHGGYYGQYKRRHGYDHGYNRGYNRGHNRGYNRRSHSHSFGGYSHRSRDKYSRRVHRD